MLARLRRWFAYDDWANRQTLASLDRAGAPPPRAVKLMAHIIAAEWLWYKRLHGSNSRLVWPDWSLATCRLELDVLSREWRTYLDSLEEDQLADRLAYTNSKGEKFTNMAEDMLTHIVMHSAYHRGQIAMLLRDAGYEPAYTDFIEGMRRGMVE